MARKLTIKEYLDMKRKAQPELDRRHATGKSRRKYFIEVSANKKLTTTGYYGHFDIQLRKENRVSRFNQGESVTEIATKDHVQLITVFRSLKHYENKLIRPIEDDPEFKNYKAKLK